ncbi:misshapen-like kinase 1 [Sorghum bicolor]|uniref:misshapen-like kinase 1 n=1 Tax=Sorghum bicolor TaxID=4558 RepID=UPI000B42602B|nr:misshapen-like kinase 1 [Sorghum bicolor]|eukprot:XP_021311849.1 misshapen-like kinase 1 [Sorghum bicolor]
MSNEASVDDEVAARVRAAVAGDFKSEHVNGFPMRPDQGSIDLGSIDARSSKPPVKEDDVDRDKRRESTEKLKLSKDARSMDEEVKASPVTKRTSWPIGLHSVEEERKKAKEQRERESQQRLQEGQQQPRPDGEEGKEGRRQQIERLEELLEQDRQQELLEQDRQQELLELQRQQRQQSQQLEELLEPPPRSPPQPVPTSPWRPETGEEGLPVYGPSTPAWLRLGVPTSISAEPGRADGVVVLACMMRTPVDPQSEIKGIIGRA